MKCEYAFLYSLLNIDHRGIEVKLLFLFFYMTVMDYNENTVTKKYILNTSVFQVYFVDFLSGLTDNE